jgi:hypothetical protein
MPLSMTTNAVAVTYIVVQLALEFARYKFPLDGGHQIRSLEPLREGSGELMGGVLLGLVGLRVRFFSLFICACVELALVFSVLVILFVARVLGVGSGLFEQIGDRGFDTPELGWVRTLFYDGAYSF